MNKLIIIGNVTFTPELRTTPGGTNVTNFTVAVTDRRDKEKTEFFRVVAWGKLGEKCAELLWKGKTVCVVGEVSCRAFQGRDGEWKAAMEINASEVEFLSPAKQNDDGYYQDDERIAKAKDVHVRRIEEIEKQMDNPADGFVELTDPDLPF